MLTKIRINMLGLVSFLVVVGIAEAGDNKRYVLSDAYKDECGGCHVAFPPQLLPEVSWRALMDGLQTHFGTDASIDEEKVGEVRNFLAANAGGNYKYASGAAGDDGGVNLHLSRTSWFMKEHRDGHDGLTSAVWKSTAVKSPSNCSACHRDAERGDYSERGIRIPY